MLRKIEGTRERGWQRMGRLDGIPDSVNMNLSQLWEIAEDTGAWHATSMGLQRVGHDLETKQQQKSPH